MKIIRTMRCALLILALTAAASGGAFALFAERPEEVGEEAAAVLWQARLLVNQGRGLEALALVREALAETGDPALEYGLVRLENRQWRQILTTTYWAGNVWSSSIRVYGEDGRLRETRDYDGNGELVSVTAYEYGEDAFRFGYVTRDGSGHRTDSGVILCNEAGDSVRVEGSTVSEYTRDAFGDYIQIVDYRADGTPGDPSFYEFNEYGSFTRMTYRDQVTAYDLVYEFSADRKTMTVRYYGAGTDRLEFTIEYEFVPFE